MKQQACGQETRENSPKASSGYIRVMNPQFYTWTQTQWYDTDKKQKQKTVFDFGTILKTNTYEGTYSLAARGTAAWLTFKKMTS